MLCPNQAFGAIQFYCLPKLVQTVEPQNSGVTARDDYLAKMLVVSSIIRLSSTIIIAITIIIVVSESERRGSANPTTPPNISERAEPKEREST